MENKLSHTRGAVSMARSSDPDSASSQFFIVQQDSTYLDGQYACFGYVTKGMDVVDAMACVDTQQDEEGNDTWRPTEENTITIESVTISTYPGPTAEELAAQSESSDAAASESASTDGEAVG